MKFKCSVCGEKIAIKHYYGNKHCLCFDCLCEYRLMVDGLATLSFFDVVERETDIYSKKDYEQKDEMD